MIRENDGMMKPIFLIIYLQSLIETGIFISYEVIPWNSFFNLIASIFSKICIIEVIFSPFYVNVQGFS